jgi:hypothetical protein
MAGTPERASQSTEWKSRSPPALQKFHRMTVPRVTGCRLLEELPEKPPVGSGGRIRHNKRLQPLRKRLITTHTAALQQ